MAVDLGELTDDLAAETAELRAMLAGLDARDWLRPTPAAGWTIADQVSHLAFFDDAAVTAATDPDEFAARFGRPAASGELSPDDVAERFRSLSAAELLAWLDRARLRLIEVFSGLDPATRLPWFGLPMSAASSVTARIMETWAHGQDIADALGVSRMPTARLRHIAHIGVRALPYSFGVHGLGVPAEPVRVELTGPAAERWSWGPPDAANRVLGPALDFCLLVTQRRHLADLAVTAEGPVALQWLTIAQAFAGPPGPGREPAASGGPEPVADR